MIKRNYVVKRITIMGGVIFLGANDRFIIECNGIIDTWNPKGEYSDRLTYGELCHTLNELNELVDDEVDEYKTICMLKKEIKDLNQVIDKYRRNIKQLYEEFQKIEGD